MPIMWKLSGHWISPWAAWISTPCSATPWRRSTNYRKLVLGSVPISPAVLNPFWPNWKSPFAAVSTRQRPTAWCRVTAPKTVKHPASVDDSRRLEELTKDLERPTTWNGRKVRGLRVLGEDNEMLLAVSRGEFNLNGFRNRDLQRLLYDGKPANAAEGKRRCAAMSRKLRMVRAHGLIKKVPHTHRYVLTDDGRVAIAAISAAQHATVAQLSKVA